jgi:hypothetical protein
LREELPGLKLSQYKDRIFNNWKTSPENPMNQPRKAAASGKVSGDDDGDIGAAADF